MQTLPFSSGRNSDPNLTFPTPSLAREVKGRGTVSLTFPGGGRKGNRRARTAPTAATSAGARDGSAPARGGPPLTSGAWAAAPPPCGGGVSRGSFLSVSGRLGAGDCWRGAWSLALVPLRLLSRLGPLRSSLTPGELSLPPRCRPISRGRKMPSNAPTVSRESERAGLGRPEASEVEGPGPPPHCSAARLRPERLSMRPACRRSSLWLSMVSLLAFTDRGWGGGWEVRSREPSL